MSRQPVNIVALEAAGKPFGRQAVWEAMRRLKTFTRRELRVNTPHVSAAIANDYLNAMLKGGYVETAGTVKGQSAGDSRVTVYLLCRDTGVDAPRLKKDGSALIPTGQQRMWLCMKVMSVFSAAELAAAAAVPGAEVSEAAAEDYVKHLNKAAYLCELPGPAKQYRLINDTGGRAPMIQRTKVVFDPNLSRVMGLEPLQDE